MTLASARSMAAEINRKRASGEDVVAAKHREEIQREILDSKTFDKAAIDFVEQHVIPNTRRWQSQARLLGLRPKADGSEGLEFIPKGLASRWSTKAVAEIDGDDIFAFIDEVREKGVSGIERRNKKPSEPRARTMFATLSKMFAWLLERRRVKHNPCVGVHKPKAPKARERVLTDAEIVKFWLACDDLTQPFGHALKLLLLTGSRLDEVTRMARSELNDDGTVWTIPGERTKNHRTHVVPLSTVAREVLANVGGAFQFVFTTQRTRNQAPISGWSKIKEQIDAKMGTPPWRIHDLRRTCATGMAEIGIPPHIIESVLNHVSGAKAGVAGTYNRSVYSTEKKAALERWAVHINHLVHGRQDNVVAIRGTAS
jgi:integrase